MTGFYDGSQPYYDSIAFCHQITLEASRTRNQSTAELCKKVSEVFQKCDISLQSLHKGVRVRTYIFTRYTQYDLEETSSYKNQVVFILEFYYKKAGNTF